MEKGKADYREKTLRISDTGIMELEAMEFYAFHGCLERERKEGNTFLVDFKAEIPISEAASSDDLSDTPNYADIYAIISSEMAVPSDLLEHLAARIVNAIALAFPQLGDFSVRVSKKNPPVGGKMAWARITCSHKKED